MPSGAIIEDLAEVRMKLDRACERLTVASAESLDDSSEDLDSAVRQLADCQARLVTQAGDPAALEEAWRVRRSFVRARRLLHQAAAFHANWMRVRGAMSGGYTRMGEPEAVRHTGRVFLQAQNDGKSACILDLFG